MTTFPVLAHCECEHERHSTFKGVLHDIRRAADTTHPGHAYMAEVEVSPVETIYGQYLMCSGCANCLPKEYRK